MTQSNPDFLPLQVINVGADGKRSFDKRDQQRLVEACLEPGVSVAGMALKAGVNANQLRRWMSKYKVKRGGTPGTALNGIGHGPPVFVPVVEARGGTDAHAELDQPMRPEPSAAANSALNFSPRASAAISCCV